MRKFGPPQRLWPAFQLSETYRDPLNLCIELLDRAVKNGSGGRTAVIDGDSRLSYHQLLRLVIHATASLKELNVRQGDRVLIQLANNLDFLIIYLATQRLGAVTVPIYEEATAAELSSVATLVRPRAIVLSDSASESLDRKGLGRAEVIRSSRLRRGSPGEVPAVLIDPDEASLVMFTSGSGGRPKGCIHTTRECLTIIDLFARGILRGSQSDVFVGTPPLAFVYGHNSRILWPLGVMGATALDRIAFPDDFFKVIRRTRATVFFSTPVFYRWLIEKNDAPPSGDFGLRLAVSSGDVLERDVAEKWTKLMGVPILNCLGSTEFLDGYISTRTDYKATGSAGKPIRGFTCRVLGGSGDECEVGTVGELVLRGPTGTRYWRNVRAQRTAVRGGWCHTNDLVRKDENGYFWYVGRKDQVIKIAGFLVTPEEVESAIRKHSNVREAAVLATKGGVLGRKLTALVVSKKETVMEHGSLQDVRSFVASRLTWYKVPSDWFGVEALPKTRSGKLKRDALLALLPSGLG